MPRLFKHALHDDPNLDSMYELCEKKNALAIKCKDTKQELRDARTGTKTQPNILKETKLNLKTYHVIS